MAKERGKGTKKAAAERPAEPAKTLPASNKGARPSALLDTRVIYCGDNLEQLAKLPDPCVDLLCIDPAPVSQADPPFGSFYYHCALSLPCFLTFGASYASRHPFGRRLHDLCNL